jgi:Ca2+-binding EF-hand superfamily protein
MDVNEIGLVDYSNFINVLKNSMITASKVKDNFDWEEMIIQKLKEWIREQGMNSEEAFKCLDKDFDGTISKDDLKTSL